MIETTTPTYLDPLLHTVFGKIMLVAWVVMLGLGSYWIKKITTLEV